MDRRLMLAGGILLIVLVVIAIGMTGFNTGTPTAPGTVDVPADSPASPAEPAPVQ